MFEFTPQSPGRNVRFSWEPPALLNRNGDIINYNLTCTAGMSIVTANYSSAGTYILNGFEALTTYTCSVYAQNAAGSGPPDTRTETTMEDGMLLLYSSCLLHEPSIIFVQFLMVHHIISKAVVLMECHLEWIFHGNHLCQS